MRLDEIFAPGSGFHFLAEEPGRAIAVGAVGKVWEPRIPFADVGPTTFAGFDEPGYAKVAWSLEVEPRVGGGTWVGVDVRVGVTSEDVWAHFRPYWAFVGPFSRAIRRSLLRDLVRRLGKPPADGDRLLGGDDILPGAPVSWTQAVTIEVPPSQVFPWLVQMGAGRAGWYSVDALDNGGVRSAERIVPELQHLSPGDVLHGLPDSPGGFATLRVEPERLIVLGSPSLLPPGDLPRAPQPGDPLYRMTWAFVLEPIGSSATRLVARVRGEPFPGPAGKVARAALWPVHAFMEHEQLRHLKARAEAHPAA
jgi:hypothetical protein